MKKLLLLLFLHAFFSHRVAAQNEYLQHNPQWTVMEVWSMTYPCVAYDTVTFYLNGDTLINSLTYKKLYAQGTCRNVWYSQNPNMGCGLAAYNYPYAGYNGALRSAGTQIFYIQSNASQEVLLFDYNLQVGDTFPYSPMTTQNGSVTVAFIDSVYTPYGYLEKFHFSTDTSKFVMEGGLSSYGLYHYCDVMMDFSSWSMCYSLNDTAWWPTQGPDCGAILLSTTALQQPQLSLALVPNPARDYVTVSLPGAVLNSVTVYNVFGAVVKTQSRDAQVYVGDLPAGIYFVKVSDGATQYTQELLVE